MGVIKINDKIELVSKMHNDSWRNITTHFGVDVTAPFLYTSTRNAAYENMLDSLNADRIEQKKIPVTHALLYYDPGKIIDSRFRPIKIELYYGGTLIHEARAKIDTEEELSVNCTVENSRNFLRYNSPIFGIAYPFLEYHRDILMHNFLDQLEDIVSKLTAYQVLRDKVDDDTFFKSVYLDTIIIDNSFKGNIIDEALISELKKEKVIENHSKKLKERYFKIMEKMGELNPLDWENYLKEFVKNYGMPQLESTFALQFEDFKNFNLLVKKREINGAWTKLDIFSQRKIKYF